MAIFGKPGASYLQPGRLDIFVRSREATLVHLWLADGEPGALDLGGRVDRFAEPVAVHRDPQGLDVFAVGGLKLLHWRWDAARGRMIGPEQLPGYIATRPVPVADGDYLYVFAADLGDRLRYWRCSPGGLWSHDTLTDVGAADLVAVHRRPGIIDTYSASYGIVHQVFGGEWHGPVLLPRSDTESGVALVAAIAWTDDHGFVRQDVYGRLGDGTLRHWGYGYFASPDPTDWWGPDPVSSERLPFEAAVAARGPDIVFRDEDGRLHHWIWQHGERRWDDFSPLTTGWHADPVIVERTGASAGYRCGRPGRGGQSTGGVLEHPSLVVSHTWSAQPARRVRRRAARTDAGRARRHHRRRPAGVPAHPARRPRRAWGACDWLPDDHRPGAEIGRRGG